MMKRLIIILLLIPSLAGATTLLQEDFADANFGGRGWYDGTGGGIVTTEHIPGSTSSFECHFLTSGTKCNGSDFPLRHAITATDRAYIKFWYKHSTNWVGSGTTYHPHIMYLLTNKDLAYSGFADTYLTTYVEENQGYPQLDMADGTNIDEANIDNTNPISLTTTTGAVAGCSGLQSGLTPNIGQYGGTDCYVLGTSHTNGIYWRGPSAVFFDAAQKINWNLIEVYFQMNTITGNTANRDGIVRYWLNGTLIIDHTNVVFRKAANSTMLFNQFALSPYIGDGSPADQYFWIDDLLITDTVPSSGQAPLMPPGNFRVW